MLSDEFTHLRAEERQQLLHEGTGDRVVNAYVEIIFDNTDKRVPVSTLPFVRFVVKISKILRIQIDNDEIFLRRAIGMKKDQYLLNKKVVSRSEVVKLFESAGFSDSNPYYIVKQGKINEIATAHDSYRLQLMREAAGTRVYDERKSEFMDILRDTGKKLEKTAEFLQIIENRLNELAMEKDELKEYQNWDKMRRTLEFLIHEAELKENRKALDELEGQWKSSGDKKMEFLAEVQNAQEKIKSIEKRLKDAGKSAATAKNEKIILIDEQHEWLTKKTQLDLTIADLTSEVQLDAETKENAKNDLLQLQLTIEVKEKDLNDLRSKYDIVKRKEEECSREISLKELKRMELYAKQARHKQFLTRGDRDKWIQNELKMLRKQIEDKVAHHNKLMNDVADDEIKRAEFESKINELTAKMEQMRDQIDEQSRQHSVLTKKKKDHQAARE